MGVRAGTLCGLVVLGVAGLVRADDAAQPRKSYGALDREYQRAKEVHGDVGVQILKVQRLLQVADLKLAPLRAVEADLARRLAKDDPQLGEARKAVIEKVLELQVPQNQNRLAQLIKEEVETREAAIGSGTAALQAMLRHVDRMGAANVNRDPQVAEVCSRALIVMQELDELEDQGTQLINEFKPLAAAPESPHEIEELVQIYEDDAKKCAELASSLSQHAARVDAQRVPLLKLQEDGVTLEVVKVRVKTLADRLEELETAAERARKRAEGDAKEIDALNQKKARLEGGVGRKGTNEGPDK